MRFCKYKNLLNEKQSGGKGCCSCDGWGEGSTFSALLLVFLNPPLFLSLLSHISLSVSFLSSSGRRHKMTSFNKKQAQTKRQTQINSNMACANNVDLSACASTKSDQALQHVLNEETAYRPWGIHRVKSKFWRDCRDNSGVARTTLFLRTPPKNSKNMPRIVS